MKMYNGVTIVPTSLMKNRQYTQRYILIDMYNGITVIQVWFDETILDQYGESYFLSPLTYDVQGLEGLNIVICGTRNVWP